MLASVINPEQYAIQRINPSIKKHSRSIVTAVKTMHAVYRCTKIQNLFIFSNNSFPHLECDYLKL